MFLRVPLTIRVVFVLFDAYPATILELGNISLKRGLSWSAKTIGALLWTYAAATFTSDKSGCFQLASLLQVEMSLITAY